jgi:hypothetical protein
MSTKTKANCFTKKQKKILDDNGWIVCEYNDRDDIACFPIGEYDEDGVEGGVDILDLPTLTMVKYSKNKYFLDLNDVALGLFPTFLEAYTKATDTISTNDKAWSDLSDLIEEQESK